MTNSAACPLTLADGFNPCTEVTADSFAMDPNFRIGYAQTWQVSVQRDLPAALQLVATYLGVKGTHGVQEFLPNTYPIGAAAPCPDCPSGFVYRTSGGNSTRESGLLQLRRRLRSGFTATLLYTYAKSIDDDAYLGGLGHTTASAQSQSEAGANAAIAQNWLNPRAERARFQLRSAPFDQSAGAVHQRRRSGWRKPDERLAGQSSERVDGDYADLRGNRFCRRRLSTLQRCRALRSQGPFAPRLPAHPFTRRARVLHQNAAAYSAPLTGQWGTAGRNSITGPRTVQPGQRAGTHVSAEPATLTSTLAQTQPTCSHHAAFTGWNATTNSTQYRIEPRG